MTVECSGDGCGVDGERLAAGSCDDLRAEVVDELLGDRLPSVAEHLEAEVSRAHGHSPVGREAVPRVFGDDHDDLVRGDSDAPVWRSEVRSQGGPSGEPAESPYYPEDMRRMAAHSLGMSDNRIRGRDVGGPANDTRFAGHEHAKPEVTLSSDADKPEQLGVPGNGEGIVPKPPILRVPARPAKADPADLAPPGFTSVSTSVNNPLQPVTDPKGMLQRAEDASQATDAEAKGGGLMKSYYTAAKTAWRTGFSDPWKKVTEVEAISEDAREKLKDNPASLSKAEIIMLVEQFTASTTLSRSAAPVGSLLKPAATIAAGAALVVGGVSFTLVAVAGVAAGVYSVVMWNERRKHAKAIKLMRGLDPIKNSESAQLEFTAAEYPENAYLRTARQAPHETPGQNATDPIDLGHMEAVSDSESDSEQADDPTRPPKNLPESPDEKPSDDK
jgi:hypothetical protein